MANVLIADDDELICEMLSRMTGKMGHSPVRAGTLADASRMASSQSFDVVFLDIRMPDGNGIDLLPELRNLPSCPEVIIITGLGDPDGAELAIRNGAWDYISKSSSLKDISLALIRALQYREEKLTRQPLAALRVDSIIGSSVRIRECINTIAQVAGNDASVLLSGETGTGKELFARAIHDNSTRAKADFVVVDCTTLPETLVESILFGHERGAYTGADRPQEGLIRQAHGGTLFLDEIGELPLPVQKSFLRVLNDRRFRSVGGKQEVESDFRLISATNRNLEDMVKTGLFRADLWFRIRTFIIELPPLKDHLEDVKELAVHYMMKFCERYRIGPKGFSPEFFDTLTVYDWPGNVRELVNAIEQAVAVAKTEPTLFPKHLPVHLRAKIARSALVKERSTKNDWEDIPPVHMPTLGEYRQTMDTKYLRDLLNYTRGNIREACSISGLSRSRLYALLKEYRVTG
jgi:two-component system NtrC family response regulator